MDYTDFHFGKYYTKDLHLVVVSSNDRYEKNLLPDPQDYTEEVPGADGAYYFGQLYRDREISCNIAFDKITEQDFRKISQIFSTDIPQDLVFDEMPFKTYKAKLKSKPEFTYICFKDRKTGERVYKGEGTLNFVCYFPYAYCFNRYVVRAADYYLETPPETIIKHSSLYENPYKKEETKIYNKYNKKYYNVENNMATPWKGGYPTIEQVQAGELYFNTPNGEKSIIDVRGYWDNVPLWQSTAKLLTTPTLDYDQELIYLPQYTKTDYYNMDIGFNSVNGIIGSRLLVYNPGDLPVDFELKFDNNERTFWMERGNHFQVRRFNVQRLTIPQAVGWTGLTTYDHKDNKNYKYGKRYFKYITMTSYGDGQFAESIQNLKHQHPNHTYIVEPIPQQRLGHFIKLFYWQSKELDFEEGIRLANRYNELYNKCLTDDERNELYWKTLKEAILNKYKDKITSNGDNYTIENFIYDYIYNPPEYIRRNFSKKYGEFDFNLDIMPQYITEDYFDIITDGIEKTSLYLDTEKEMLYNVSNPTSDFYHYKPKKNIYNENIKQGKWFKIPPGWSMIEVAPVCDEDNWGGKRWLDARPFDWGYGGEKEDIQKIFDTIFKKATMQYLYLIKRMPYSETYNWNDSYVKRLDFRHTYDKYLTLYKDDNFKQELYKTRSQNLEYGFLKMIHRYWKNAAKTELFKTLGLKGEISEWWWYASNYLWEHFPPLYWGYADLLNKAKIKYTPLFY